MKVEIIKDYINVDKMADSVFEILKNARDDFKDGEIDGFLDDNYDDDYLHERALEQAIEWNDDMKKYLHMKDHRILGNFNNIEYDYPHHINGEYEYDTPLVNDLIKRLDEGKDDEQTNEDRDWLVDWFFDTFGTYGIKYNFQSEMSDNIYDYKQEHEMAEA